MSAARRGNENDPPPPTGTVDASPEDFDRAVARLAFLTSVSEVLGESLELDKTLDKVVRLAVPELADIASIELLRDGSLRVAAMADVDEQAERILRQSGRGMRLDDFRDYPPWRVIESGVPMLVPEVGEDVYRRFVSDPERLEFLLARRAGTGMCVPLRARDQILGTMSFARLVGRPSYDRDDLSLAMDLAQRAALAIDNAQLFRAIELELEARRRTEQVQHFLADVTRVLADELDHEGSLRALARQSVPFLGDLCLIDVADGEQIRRAAAVHADPAHQAVVDELERGYPPDTRGDHPAVRAIRYGERSWSATMSDEFLRSTTRDERHLELVRGLGFNSYVCVPLQARGRVIGAFTLISCDQDRRFGPHDLDLADEVASRAALLVDNARLLSERTHVARALQATLLPPDLPVIPRIDLAARYVAAGEGAEVGGDFYDVFWAGYGSWIIAVGDVCGKGPEAAAITGLARHTLRAFASRDRDPRRILQALHEALVKTPSMDERFCTVVCAQLRFTRGQARMKVSSAGHPPPFVLRHDGMVESIAVKGSLLGALEEISLQSTNVALAPGDTIVFYTDGVTETRAGRELFGEDRLREAIGRQQGQQAGAVADALLADLQRFSGGAPRDDIAVVVARVDAD